MAKYFFLLILCSLAFIQYSFSQDIKVKDTITINTSGDLKLSLHGESLNMRRVSELLKPNPEAYSFVKKAKANTAVGFTLAYLGGFAIGYDLGMAISGKSINWAFMGAGIGAIGISIPFAIGARRNLKKAVLVYNAGK